MHTYFTDREAFWIPFWLGCYFCTEWYLVIYKAPAGYICRTWYHRFWLLKNSWISRESARPFGEKCCMSRECTMYNIHHDLSLIIWFGTGSYYFGMCLDGAFWEGQISNSWGVCRCKVFIKFVILCLSAYKSDSCDFSQIVYGSKESLESYCAHFLLSRDIVYFVKVDNRGSSTYQPRPSAQVNFLNICVWWFIGFV
jgi:hypothetical protein